MASLIPENQARFTLGEVAQITGGELQGPADLTVSGVATDSRADLLGKLFIALPGERYDGHAFVSAALRAGARALLVEREVGETSAPRVRVASSYQALGALAQALRRRWGGRLIAVGGSAGKTTTKFAVTAALESLWPGKVHYAAGNLNNRVGVPFVLLGLAPQHRAAVVEIGTNALGEVAELTRLAEPDLGLITLVGLEHTEGLGDIEQIELEEGALLRELSPEASAVGNADDERVMRQLERSPARNKLRFGFAERADYRVLSRRVSATGGARLRLGRRGRDSLEVDCPLLGRAGAYAACAALCAVESLSSESLSGPAFADALQGMGAGEPGRLTPRGLANGTLVLDDTYNSNPASLTSSVETAAELARARGGRLLLVLGEMRELGENSPALHRKAGESIAELGAHYVVGLTGDARWLLEPFAQRGIAHAFAEDPERAISALPSELGERDVVLVKASRSIRAERVVERLLELHGRRA